LAVPDFLTIQIYCSMSIIEHHLLQENNQEINYQGYAPKLNTVQWVKLKARGNPFKKWLYPYQFHYRQTSRSAFCRPCLSFSIMFYHFLSFSISIHIYPHLSTFTRSHSPASEPLTSHLCHPAFWTTSKLALHFCNISNNPSSLVASIAFPALAALAMDGHGWTIKDAQVNERSERSLEIFW